MASSVAAWVRQGAPMRHLLSQATVKSKPFQAHIQLVSYSATLPAGDSGSFPLEFLPNGTQGPPGPSPAALGASGRPLLPPLYLHPDISQGKSLQVPFSLGQPKVVQPFGLLTPLALHPLGALIEVPIAIEEPQPSSEGRNVGPLLFRWRPRKSYKQRTMGLASTKSRRRWAARRR